MNGKFCPLIRKNCVEHKCAWYTNLIGKDPQTNQDINNWGCSVAFTPILQMEAARMSRGTTASIDNLRKEHEEASQMQAKLMSAQVQLTQQAIVPVSTHVLPE